MAYKSKYYDPVKAHEYYLKHRKLKAKKGKAKKVSQKDRLSTEGLNEAGKEASARAKAEMTVKLNAFKQQLKQQLKQKIAELESQELDDNEKAIRAQMIKDQISELRSQASKQFKEEYAQQMDAIKANKEYKS